MNRSLQLPSSVLESLEQVVTIKGDLFFFEHEPILNLPYSIYYPIEKAINRSQNLRELTAALPPNYKMDSATISELEGKISVGDAFLHRLSDLGMSFRELFELMKKVEFWTGLEHCCDDFRTVLVENIPSKVTLKHNEPLELSCKAAGVPAPKYQWFYSPNRNTQPCSLDGQNKPKLTMNSPRSGVVCCSICNTYNNIFTAVCEIKVGQPPQSPRQPVLRKYKAKGKVALLIGNGDYCKPNTPLNAPKNDILDIGKELMRIGFKTLICKNLDLAGMNTIIDTFIDLLMNDEVYGVLYFAGHGFETTEGSYLMPTDCGAQCIPSHCISVSDLHRRVLDKDPALCLIMLDVCRTRKEVEKYATDSEKNSDTPKANRSTLLVHATNENMSAFETKGEDGHSLFAKHLLKHIREDISVIELMTIKVIRGFATDQTAGKKMQIPEVKMTLSSDRTLHDKVDFDGSTKIHKRNLLNWAEMTRKPDMITVTGQTAELDCIVKIKFENTYSNCLEVYIACFETDTASQTSKVETTAKIVESSFGNIAGEPFPQLKMSPLERDTKVQKLFSQTTQKFLSITAYEITSLERLHEDLMIGIQVEVKTDSEKPKSKLIRDLNLYRPLFSGLDFLRSSGHSASSGSSSVFSAQFSHQSSIGSLRLMNSESDTSLASVQGEPDINTLQSNPQDQPRTYPLQQQSADHCQPARPSV